MYQFRYQYLFICWLAVHNGFNNPYVEAFLFSYLSTRINNQVNWDNLLEPSYNSLQLQSLKNVKKVSSLVLFEASSKKKKSGGSKGIVAPEFSRLLNVGQVSLW